MAGTLSPWPQISQGAKEHPVATLQYLLRARGKTVTVDGDFGPQTDTQPVNGDETGELTPGRAAAYIAKYATKSARTSGSATGGSPAERWPATASAHTSPDWSGPAGTWAS